MGYLFVAHIYIVEQLNKYNLKTMYYGNNQNNSA